MSSQNRKTQLLPGYFSEAPHFHLNRFNHRINLAAWIIRPDF
jgi:hypothetical protein